MTITLHWWVLPTALLIAAAILLAIGWRRTGFMSGLAEGMLAFILTLCALMFTTGHYL